MGRGRFRFGEFTLSPQRRLLVRDGRDVPLIPRYFDLLLLLIERRHEAVHRREIFDRVWADVIVSESALSQAVRTVRSTLGDDSKEPRFIRTVSRHGYQFVFPEVIEEDDDGPTAAPAPVPPAAGIPATVEATQAAPLAAPEGRWRQGARAAALRWSGPASGAALAGLAAGTLGGLVLAAAPGSHATVAIAPVLAVVGGAAGALGGAGVGAGLGFAEAAGPAPRLLALTAGGALGGGLIGVAVQWLARWGLSALVGLDLPIGGGLEGVVIGGATGLGVALATVGTPDGPAARRSRLQVALVTAACSGLGALVLVLAGRLLVSGSIHAIANAASGSHATLAPLGRLIGEADFGRLSGAILALVEGGGFGIGLGYGLFRRPRAPLT
jgi:DNA-binding winged helix-turn-helix (wHTH) protein